MVSTTGTKQGFHQSGVSTFRYGVVVRRVGGGDDCDNTVLFQQYFDCTFELWATVDFEKGNTTESAYDFFENKFCPGFRVIPFRCTGLRPTDRGSNSL
jgi:hypothetical protein